MAKKLSSALGVDLGSQFIKIAEVRNQGGQPVVTALGMAATPEGAVDQMGVHDGAAISAVLKELASQAGASTNDVVISLAGQQAVLVRTLEVPTMSDSELDKHMEWEITRNIPFNESTVVSDFKAFPPESADAQNMDVVMAIAPQSAAVGLTELVRKASKKPAALDVEPLCLARCLTSSYGSEHGGKSVCVIDVGHKTTSINIYKDGKLLMPRTVPVGGEAFTRAIADNMGMSFEEAEQLKHEKAEVPLDGVAQSGGGAPAFGETQQFAPYNPFADSPGDAAAPAEGEAAPAEAEAAPEPAPEPAPAAGGLPEDVMRIYTAMAPVVDDFTSEVRRSIDFFRSKGGTVEHLMLCGGGSRLNGLSAFLGNALGLSSELLDPMKNISVNARKADTSQLEETSQDFAIAIGNGLYACY